MALPTLNPMMNWAKLKAAFATKSPRFQGSRPAVKFRFVEGYDETAIKAGLMNTPFNSSKKGK